MSLCALNGEIMPLEKARISPMDRGFLFGDGVYEVLACVDGRIRAASLHRARLQQSLAAIALDVSVDAVFDDLQRVLEASGLQDAKLYVQATRGPAAVREHSFPSVVEPTVFLTVSPFTARRLAPVSALVREDIRWRRNAIKSTSLLANVLLQQEAKALGAGEAILHRDQWVTEASTSNVFLLKDRTLRTPPLSDDILPGITRHLVLELAHDLGLEVNETPVSVSELASAETLFVSSSTRGLMPIDRLEPGGQVGAGGVHSEFEALASRYDELLHEHP